MKKLFLLTFFFSSLILANKHNYFATHPSLSPDAETVIFSYEGDIWSLKLDTKKAFRLTAMEGRETNPLISPDGNWIAFTGRQDGNSNIYLMPVNGGIIKQLTFNDANDVIESWDWNSKTIFFSSNRYNENSVYKISIDGGTPERLFEGFFNWPHNLVKHPGKDEYFFNETWESMGYASRKRYRGDFNPDIKSYNSETRVFTAHTSYDGKDLWPTIDKNGNIFFASDETNGEYNLCSFVNGEKRTLTNFETSILNPRVSANGEKVVFEKDYQLFIYDVKNNKSELIDFSLITNDVLKISQEFNTSGKISRFDVSPDNKKIAFVSRGELFVSDIDGKYVKHIPTKTNERVIEVLWLKDNLTLLISQTTKGWANLFTIKADGSSKEKQITNQKQNDREIRLSNDKSKAVYFSGRDEMKLLDLENFENKVIVKDEFWALYSVPAYFSPDNKFITYVAQRNFEKDIFIYDIQNNSSINLTKSGVEETAPYWSPDGKYIYFQADRINPSYPRGERDSEIYRIGLQKYDKDFKSDRFDKLFTEEKKDTSKPAVIIDPDGFVKRWETMVDHPFNQIVPVIFMDGDETTLLYSSNHDNEGRAMWKTVFKPFEKPKSTKIEGTKNPDMNIRSAKKTNYTLIEGNIVKLNLKQGKTDKITISENFKKNLSDEFSQMFYETCVNVEENFYDENFHGENFSKIKTRYEKYLSHLTSRDDLRRLIRDLLGELNSSHQNFYSNGTEEKVFYKSKTLNTGIVYENLSPFVVKHIVQKSAADKTNINIKPGDRLIAVNGNRINENENREKYFSAPELPEETTLTFSRKEKTFDVKIHPQSSQQFKTNLYDEWEEENQKYVDEKSDKRISYIHMKDMGTSELTKFIIEVTNELHYRDGLILDLRNNRGGNVHDAVLQLLSQRPYLQWKYREGKMTVQPNFIPSAKPIVLLINEQSLSDAEMTAAGFKALKLGTIIGTQTYRWIIFTSGRGLVDGSFYRLPSWGCYTLDGTNLERNGVEPDVYIKNTFKDRLENKDPQLDCAINEIMQKL